MHYYILLQFQLLYHFVQFLPTGTGSYNMQNYIPISH